MIEEGAIVRDAFSGDVLRIERALSRRAGDVKVRGIKLHLYGDNEGLAEARDKVYKVRYRLGGQLYSFPESRLKEADVSREEWKQRSRSSSRGEGRKDRAYYLDKYREEFSRFFRLFQKGAEAELRRNWRARIQEKHGVEALREICRNCTHSSTDKFADRPDRLACWRDYPQRDRPLRVSASAACDQFAGSGEAFKALREAGKWDQLRLAWELAEVPGEAATRRGSDGGTYSPARAEAFLRDAGVPEQEVDR